jgi:hypothetical protein
MGKKYIIHVCAIGAGSMIIAKKYFNYYGETKKQKKL